MMLFSESEPTGGNAVPSPPHNGVDDQPVADLSGAPLPTRSTLRRRRSLPAQALRFLSFNLRIMRMVVKGHKHSR